MLMEVLPLLPINTKSDAACASAAPSSARPASRVVDIISPCSSVSGRPRARKMFNRESQINFRLLSDPRQPSRDSRGGWTWTFPARVLEKVAKCSADSVLINSGALTRLQRLNWGLWELGSAAAVNVHELPLRSSRMVFFFIWPIFGDTYLSNTWDTWGKERCFHNPALSRVRSEGSKEIFFSLLFACFHELTFPLLLFPV